MPKVPKQHYIEAAILAYATSQAGSDLAAGVKDIYTGEGVCHGLSFTWMLSRKISAKPNPDNKNRDDETWFKDCTDLITRWHKAAKKMGAHVTLGDILWKDEINQFATKYIHELSLEKAQKQKELKKIKPTLMGKTKNYLYRRHGDKEKAKRLTDRIQQINDLLLFDPKKEYETDYNKRLAETYVQGAMDRFIGSVSLLQSPDTFLYDSYQKDYGTTLQFTHQGKTSQLIPTKNYFASQDDPYLSDLLKHFDQNTAVNQSLYIGGGGHACVVEKTGNNQYAFYDPNYTIFENLNLAALKEKIKQMYNNKGVVVMTLIEEATPQTQLKPPVFYGETKNYPAFLDAATQRVDKPAIAHITEAMRKNQQTITPTLLQTPMHTLSKIMRRGEEKSLTASDFKVLQKDKITQTIEAIAQQQPGMAYILHVNGQKCSFIKKDNTHFGYFEAAVGNREVNKKNLINKLNSLIATAEENNQKVQIELYSIPAAQLIKTRKSFEEILQETRHKSAERPANTTPLFKTKKTTTAQKASDAIQNTFKKLKR